MVFHSFPKINVVATPNLFLNSFSFSVRLYRRYSGCDTNNILTHTREPEVNQATKYLKEQKKLASLTLSGSTEVH